MQTSPRFNRRPPAERRVEILQVARRHFAEYGYAATSLTDLAGDAGVNRGLVYHYFGTKRDLYLAVLQESLRVPPFPELKLSGADLDGALAAAVTAWLDDVTEQPGSEWLAATEMARKSAADPELAEAVEQARRTTIRAALGQGAGRQLEAAALCVAAFAEEAVVRWVRDGLLTRDEVHRLVLGALRSAVDAAS